MKMFLRGLAATLALAAATGVSAQDVGKLVDAVDQDKAKASVDTEGLTEAVSGGEVDYKKAYDSVDKEKAADSVDMDKVKKALTDEE
jgi:hypothetical protein